MMMDPATVFMLGVTVTGAVVSVIKTVKDVKDFVDEVKHVDDKVQQFASEMEVVVLTLDLIKSRLQKVESNPSTPGIISPRSAIAKSLDACYSSAFGLSRVFQTLGRRKVVKELKLLSNSGPIEEFRRRLGDRIRLLLLQTFVLMYDEVQLFREPSQQLLTEFRAWRKEFPNQIASLPTHETENNQQIQQLMEVASLACEEGENTEAEFRGYSDPTKARLIEQWVEHTARAGPPPSQASSPPTLAFAETEINDRRTPSPSDAATVINYPAIPVSHEIMKVKYGLITKGLEQYNLDSFETARKRFQHAIDMGSKIPVLSFDDCMTEERLSLWLCLSSFRAARLSKEPQRSTALKQAHSLFTKIDYKWKSSPTPRRDSGRHLDAILLAENHLYGDALPEAESVCYVAEADIESTLGTKHELFYQVVLTMACVQYAKGNVGPAQQWMKRVPAAWLRNRVQPFFDRQSALNSTDYHFLLAVQKEKFASAAHMLMSTPALGLSTNGLNYLHEAAAQGSLPLITLLVAAGSSIHARSRHDAIITITGGSPSRPAPFPPFPQNSSAADESTNDTPLFAAIRNHRLQAVRLLINLGANIESPDPGDSQSRYFTALGFAVFMGFRDIVELLLDHGAKPNPTAPSHHGFVSFQSSKPVEQPLSLAMASYKSLWSWDDSLAPLLVQRGADVNYGWYPFKPLIRAIEGGITRPVTELLAAGADVNVHDEDIGGSIAGPSPLHTAIRYNRYRGNPEIVQQLLKKGADVDYSNADHDPPLISAISNEDPDLVHLLLSWRAKPDPQGARQTSPLLEAIYLNRPDIVRLLLENGADVNRKGYLSADQYVNQRFTPLEFARKLGRRRIQKIMSEN